ncbi:hypothetical protein RMSM_01937 [Rhodopirellula maiorica SM1]|uniref:Uncharacterized protein n=1 Tax=Rhodopirellula maiorica SM1 TaxID=1265738 RepID=M5RPC5_9BACT|nr:hypothetical protein [Rhodopirellula maiorica]EMI21150.1 hypothetical protein RMSM_01937 [Rhodopirellula maiorica SM1]
MVDVILLLTLALVVGAVGFAVHTRFVERSRVANAFDYLEDIHFSQRLHFVQTGQYATQLADLDLSIPSPAYFAVGKIKLSKVDGGFSGWELQLNRVGAAPLFGSYAITFNGDGFDATQSSVAASILPHDAEHVRINRVSTFAVLR